MMTSSNGNIFRVTGHLCGEFTGPRWIPYTKPSDADLWCFLWSSPWINVWVNIGEAGELRRYRAHYGAIVMRTDVLVKVSKFLRQKVSRHKGDSNPQPSDSWWMLLTIWTIRAGHLLSHVLNTGFGDIDIYFKVKLTFEILTLRRQQHSFSTHDRMCLWKCKSFWDRKCLDLWGTRPPNLRIHAECPNHLSYQGQTFAVPYFENWLWRYKLLVVAQSN